MEPFWYSFTGAFLGAVAAIFVFAAWFVWWDTRDERNERDERRKQTIRRTT